METGRASGTAWLQKTDQQITRLTSSLDDKTKFSIDDMSNRIAMLADVTGRSCFDETRPGSPYVVSAHGEKVCKPMKKYAQSIAILLALIAETGLSAQQQNRHSDQVAKENDWSELTESMEKMHIAMGSIEPSGNSDVDFVRLMLPHHQAALDMARTDLLHGKDPQMRRLAQEIVTDQQSEIELMQLWLKQHDSSSLTVNQTPAFHASKEH